MDEGLKKFIQNSTKSDFKIYRNCTIKILQKSFLSSFLFIGAFPLYSDTKIAEKEQNVDQVAIHFGPGDENFIAIVESNEEINSSDTSKKE